VGVEHTPKEEHIVGRIGERMISMTEKVQAGRNVLKPIWKDIDFDHSDQAMGLPVPDKVKPVQIGALRIDLAPKERWVSKSISVVDGILHRESRRHFSSDSLSLEELSLLLYCTQGIRRERSSFRTVPSAGARHSFETYLYVDRVQSVERGLYRYLPDQNQICLHESQRPNMEKELNRVMFEQLYGGAVCFIWTAIPYRMEWRYSSASAKLIAIDAGHVCQNLYLACEAIGAGTCAIAAYDQIEMDRLLKIDGVDEFVIYIAPVGKVE
jgi:SagB-type dehydrogenase family enzyme